MYDAIKKFIIEKTKRNIVLFGDRLPNTAINGEYYFLEDGGWTGSFWTGINYLCFEMTGDERFIDAARRSQHRFAERLYKRPETLDHDIGFIYTLSFVADYKLTGNEDAKKTALCAASLLKSRFNEKGQFIQAWNIWNHDDQFSRENRGRIIIDCMYNLPLLFWAYEQTGDGEYYKVAQAHASTCAETIVRKDYSTFHTYVFAPDTGKPKYGRTYQGFSDSSCWARGQAWAIGGYAYAFAKTGNQRFLEIARHAAELFMENLEEDFIPMWDLMLPSKEGEPRDSSAAAIAASGMLEVSRHLTGEEQAKYIAAAKNITQSLFDKYSTKYEPLNQGLILHACGNKPAESETDCSLIYGDYFFVETVAKLMGKTIVYWI